MKEKEIFSSGRNSASVQLNSPPPGRLQKTARIGETRAELFKQVSAVIIRAAIAEENLEADVGLPTEEVKQNRKASGLIE
jgi:hypothetical protein